MRDIRELSTLRPFVATPCHGAQVGSLYARSLLGLANLAWRHGFAMQARLLDGDSLITRARNRLVAEFMADPQWTHLFWIDADIGFEPEAALRLLLAGRPVVAGLYPYRSSAWPLQGLPQALPAGSRQADFDALYARYPLNVGDTPVTADADGFVPVLDAPTGFMLIERGVFAQMAAAMPELRYTPDPGDHANAHLPHHRFFDVMAEPGGGRYLSEDYAFCRRWQQLGGTVWADLQSRLSHQGQQVQVGDLGRALAARMGPPVPAAAPAR